MPEPERNIAWGEQHAGETLHAMFAAAVDAADPASVIQNFLPEPPCGRTVVVGAGKASAAMAKAVERLWNGPLEGLVITPYGSMLDCENIELVEARHPLPDARGEQASLRILELVSELGEGDLALCLISGGGSALLTVPGQGLTLDDKQSVNRELLECGAAIDEMNCVRKHLSRVKGGRLAAAAYPATTVTLAISDVPGDDPDVIASGPTVADGTSAGDALDIIRKYRMDVPESVKDFLQSDHAATPGPGDPRLARAGFSLICKPQSSLEAGAGVAARAGYTPVILGDAIEGEAREVGTVMAGITKQILKYDQPVAAPVALISGGETTVTLRHKGGRGGRNVEFLLSFALSLGVHSRVNALACDTDGIDGSGDNAGAFWGPAVDKAGRARGLDAADYLERNDAGSYFQAADSLVVTGPTFTNVNDFRVILVDPEVTG